MDLSVIVNFYNMRREAARTLTSLSRAYQLDIDDLTYEVLCVDNGSNPPLDQAWIESFGPEFKLIRPSPPHPSPVGPINRAAWDAKGRFVAIMIDGAHVLTPGVLNSAMAAFKSRPDAVVAVRQWFMGGDQRWLAAAGYSRELEDGLFENVQWPERGYDLFLSGAPAQGRRAPWFRGMSESNCLFMSAELYEAIGGFDEGFDEPGAGLANLDLFARAIDAAPGPLIVLLGEASFHQYHSGTTTNVTVAQKDVLVRDYMLKYEEIKGEGFRPANMSKISFRGRFRSPSALKVEYVPSFPRPVAVTEAIRPLPVEESWDSEIRMRLQSTFGECVEEQRSQWLGEPIDLYPGDLVALQEMMTRSRPSRVVCVNAEPGLIRFVDSMLALLSIDDPLIVWVTEHKLQAHRTAARLKTIVADPSSKDALALVLRNCAGADGTMVLYAPRAADPFPVVQLRAYARLISPRCYLVALRTGRGQPWVGYSNSRLRGAVQKVVSTEPGLVIDDSWTRHLLTSCPSGFVLRVAGVNQGYDASLDDLSPAEGAAVSDGPPGQAPPTDAPDAGPQDLEGWKMLAAQAQASDGLEGELKVWRALLARQDDLLAHERLGALLFKAGRLEEALPHLRALAGLAAARPKLCRTLATTLFRLGHYDEATSAWVDCLAHWSALEASDPGRAGPLAEDLAARLLEHLIELVKTTNVVDAPSIRARWSHFGALYADPRFWTLVSRFPDKLQAYMIAAARPGGDASLFLEDALATFVRAPETRSELVTAARTHSVADGSDAAEVLRQADRLMADPAFHSPVLICGFHHSGTRLLAKQLIALGVLQKFNRYEYEWAYIQELNTIIQPAYMDPGRLATDDPADFQEIISPERLAFRMALAGLKEGGAWGFKEPRLCLTADAWLAAFPNARIVNIIRNPIATLGTLPELYDQFVYADDRWPTKTHFWAELWQAYLDRVRRSMASAKASVEIRFEDLCQDPAGTLAQVTGGLGLEGLTATGQLEEIRIEPGKVDVRERLRADGRLSESDLEVLDALARRYGYVESA